jgi:N-formylglutamate amidohydrolase
MTAYTLVGAPALTPLVLDSPHSGAQFPADFDAIVSEFDLRDGEDCFVDELYLPATERGVPLLAAQFPRTYLDPNRHAGDIDLDLMEGGHWPHPHVPSGKARIGKALIWRTLDDGRPIYGRKLKVDEVVGRIERCHAPYHRALAQLMDAAQARFGQVYHINCHSMPNVGGKMGEGSGQARADFVLGDRDGTTCDPAFTTFVATRWPSSATRWRSTIRTRAWNWCAPIRTRRAGGTACSWRSTSGCTWTRRRARATPASMRCAAISPRWSTRCSTTPGARSHADRLHFHFTQAARAMGHHPIEINPARHHAVARRQRRRRLRARARLRAARAERDGAGADPRQRVLRRAGAEVCCWKRRCGRRAARSSLAFANVEAFARFDFDDPDARATSTRTTTASGRRRGRGCFGPRDSVELRRARQLRPFVDSADFLLDLHSMHEPCRPIMVRGAGAAVKTVGCRA